MKRRHASPTEVSEWKREFWRATAYAALQRAASAVRRGRQVESDDREFIAMRLDTLADEEWRRMNGMSGVKLCAYVTDYLQAAKRISLNAAAAAALASYEGADAKDQAAVLKAVARLRKVRRERKRRK